jgi:hypothetical protein
VLRRASFAPLVAGVALILAAVAAIPSTRTQVVHGVQTFFNGGPERTSPNAAPSPSRKPSPQGTTTTASPFASYPAFTPTTVTVPPAGFTGVVSTPSSTAAPLPPFRMAVIVPTTGVFARESADIVKAVVAAATEANANGGVAGRKVEVVPVAANDAKTLGALSSHADVVVGGDANADAASMPWLLPADPGVTGDNVVPVEVDAHDAGTRLAQDLAARGISGKIGVVKGDGAEASLADGINDGVGKDSQVVTLTAGATPEPSSSTTTHDTTAPAPCSAEVAALKAQSAVAMAVAGSPVLAAQCIQAAEKAQWHPAGGVLLAPSAAYWHIDIIGGAIGARTVLGADWPTADTPGAARFRAAVPGSTSYRALESYAAATFAVDVARHDGGHNPSVDDVRHGTWKSDLYDFHGTANQKVAVVVLTPTGWAQPS